MGSVRETARRQCGWRRVNAREKEKERDRDRDQLAREVAIDTASPQPPVFLICKMGIKNPLPSQGRGGNM